MIVRKGQRKFELRSRSTGRVLGTHPSYAAALRQERAIKASQARAAGRANPTGSASNRSSAALLQKFERLVQQRCSRRVRLVPHGNGKIQIVMETARGVGEAISPIGTPAELSYWFDGMQMAIEFEELFHRVKTR